MFIWNKCAAELREEAGAPAGGAPATSQPATAPAATAPTAAPTAPATAPAAPAPAAPPATAPAPAAQPQQTAPVTPTETVDQAWLKTRLDRQAETARKAVLAELGVTDTEAAKAAIKAANDAAEAQKSADQRAVEAAARAAEAQAAATRHEAIIKEQAGRMMMVLTAEQQKAVTDFAGEDPAQQLRAIQAFGPTWAAAAAASQPTAAAAGAPAAPAAPATPATTSPAPGAPSGDTPTSPPDKRAVYEQTAQQNPFAAAAYAMRNPSVYETKT